MNIKQRHIDRRAVQLLIGTSQQAQEPQNQQDTDRNIQERRIEADVDRQRGEGQERGNQDDGDEARLHAGDKDEQSCQAEQPGNHQHRRQQRHCPAQHKPAAIMSSRTARRPGTGVCPSSDVVVHAASPADGDCRIILQSGENRQVTKKSERANARLCA